MKLYQDSCSCGYIDLVIQTICLPNSERKILGTMLKI
jgi:hypothetical protein